jgi:hypothetical protein
MRFCGQVSRADSRRLANHVPKWQPSSSASRQYTYAIEFVLIFPKRGTGRVNVRFDAGSCAD